MCIRDSVYCAEVMKCVCVRARACVWSVDGAINLCLMKKSWCLNDEWSIDRTQLQHVIEEHDWLEHSLVLNTFYFLFSLNGKRLDFRF